MNVIPEVNKTVLPLFKIMEFKLEAFANDHSHQQRQLLPPPPPPLFPSTVAQQCATNTNRHQDSISVSDYYSDNEPNDMDFNEMAKIAKYRQAIELILRKCESLSKDNEKLVRRLHYVKKITKNKEKDVSMLKGRLDLYNDEWRTAQPDSQLKGEMPTLIPAAVKVRKYKMRKPKLESAVKGIKSELLHEVGELVKTTNDNELRKETANELATVAVGATVSSTVTKAACLPIVKANIAKSQNKPGKGKRKRSKTEKVRLFVIITRIIFSFFTSLINGKPNHVK